MKVQPFPTTLSATTYTADDIDDEDATIVLARSGAVPRMHIIAGRYHILQTIGAGGMGRVVEANDLETGRKVAIKFMQPSSVASPDARRRFAREARAAARLKSDHVARVLDVGTAEDGAPFIVMELLVGEDLATRLERRGPLPWRVAVECMMQACEGIAEAHARGIVHRDIKPRNLFLSKEPDGAAHVKIVDFGIAKDILRRDHGQTLTRGAIALGSPHYMAPEQMASSRDVDQRTDVWAIGVCLYELCSGQRPFRASNVQKLFGKVLTRAPKRLRAVVPDAPAGLESIVARCLEKEPSARYADAAAVRDALERLVRRSQSPWRVLSPHMALGMALSAVLGAAAAGLGTWIASLP